MTFQMYSIALKSNDLLIKVFTFFQPNKLLKWIFWQQIEIEIELNSSVPLKGITPIAKKKPAITILFKLDAS